jgi:hypothetical protein
MASYTTQRTRRWGNNRPIDKTQLMEAMARNEWCTALVAEELKFHHRSIARAFKRLWPKEHAELKAQGYLWQGRRRFKRRPVMPLLQCSYCDDRRTRLRDEQSRPCCAICQQR